MIITAECCSLVIITFVQVDRYTTLALIVSVRERVQNFTAQYCLSKLHCIFICLCCGSVQRRVCLILRRLI